MRVLVVEDDELFRLGLELTLQGFTGIEAVTAVADGEQALDLLRHQAFELILLDLGLPGLGGLETCRRISADHPRIPVLMVTSQDDPVWCHRLVRAGARGYLHKGMAAADLQLAIQSVLRGASWWDAEATVALRALGEADALAAADRAAASCSPVDGTEPALAGTLALLTPREREVLEAMARGLSNREIAAELCISLGTVRVHGHQIMQKLGVANRTQAVLKLLPRRP
jgi:two-component system, NarL family, response regulator